MSTNAIAEKIEGTDEAWETRQLGANLEYTILSKIEPKSALDSLVNESFKIGIILNEF